MSKGAFIVSPDKDNPKAIKFQLASKDSIPSEEELQLKDDVERTLSVLRILFADDDIKFREYFRPLLSLSQVGLVGEGAQLETAKRDLSSLKNEIVESEAGRVKNKYMKYLGLKALWMGSIPLVFALIINWLLPQLILLGNFLILWVGCMAGVWLSFGVRKRFLSFEDLHIPEKDRLEPIIRLIFTGILTIIIGLLFSTEAVVLKIGGISTADFTKSYQVALLFGLLLGFSEKALPSVIAKKAPSLLRFER